MAGFTPTYYPVPNVNQTGDLLQISIFTNDITGGLFFPIMVLVMWAIQFIGVISEGKSASRAWILASFTSSILAIILGILALMAQRWIYLIVIGVSLGAFWLKLSGSKQ